MCPFEHYSCGSLILANNDELYLEMVFFLLFRLYSINLLQKQKFAGVMQEAIKREKFHWRVSNLPFSWSYCGLKRF